MENGKFINTKHMFGGMQPSRSAENLALRAFAIGISPAEHTIKASIACMQEGRKKVGFFGEGKKYLNALEEKIIKREWSHKSGA